MTVETELWEILSSMNVALDDTHPPQPPAAPGQPDSDGQVDQLACLRLKSEVIFWVMKTGDPILKNLARSLVARTDELLVGTNWRTQTETEII